MTWDRDEERRIHPPDKPFCQSLPTCSQRLWPRFDSYLRERNLDPALARKNFWFPSRTVDGYDRLVVPGTSDQPGNLYWQARLIQAYPVGPPPQPRRWESPHGVSRGNSVCVVWADSGPRTRVPATAIVEGPMDALAAAGEGFIAVALMGVYPPADCLSLTSRLLRGTIPVMVADRGAEKEMAENLNMLGVLGLRCVLRVPRTKDLAALDRADRKELLTRG